MSTPEKAKGEEPTQARCMLCYDLTFVVTQGWNLWTQQGWTCINLEEQFMFTPYHIPEIKTIMFHHIKDIQ